MYGTLTSKVAAFEALAFGWLTKTNIHAAHFRRVQTGSIRIIAVG